MNKTRRRTTSGKKKTQFPVTKPISKAITINFRTIKICLSGRMNETRRFCMRCVGLNRQDNKMKRKTNVYRIYWKQCELWVDACPCVCLKALISRGCNGKLSATLTRPHQCKHKRTCKALYMCAEGGSYAGFFKDCKNRINIYVYFGGLGLFEGAIKLFFMKIFYS